MNKIKRFGKRLGLVLGALIILALVARMVLNVVFGIQLRHTIKSLKTQGKPTVIEDIRPAPVPEDENAAVLYNQAFSLMTAGERKGKYGYTYRGGKNAIVSEIEKKHDNFRKNRTTRWTPKEMAEVSRLVSSPEMVRIYNLLEKTSERPKCNFNLDYAAGPALLLPHLPMMRAAARLLSFKALLEADSGDLSKSLDTVNTGLKLADHLRQEPVTVSKLIMITMDVTMLEYLQKITKGKSIPEEKARLLINTLSGKIETPYAILDGERIMWGSWILEPIKKGDASEFMGILFSIETTPADSLEVTNWGQLIGYLAERMSEKLLFWCWSPILKKDLAVYFTLMSHQERVEMEPYYTFPQATFEIPRYCVLTQSIVPALERMPNEKTVHQASLEIARTGLALKVYQGRTGFYPKALNKLNPDILKEMPVDPFTGKNLVYRRTQTGFILYSLGPNLKDDGGTRWQDDKTRYDKQPKDWKGDVVWED